MGSDSLTLDEEFNKIFHKTITKKVKGEPEFNDIEFLQIFNNELKNYKLSQSNEFEQLKDILDAKQLDAVKKVITESTLKDFLPTRTSIELKFLKMTEVRYRQLSEPFVANLSIIDTLMNCGREEVVNLLESYSLEDGRA